MALKTDGSLWGWGCNGSRQLGDGTTTSRPTPTRIGTSTDWSTVSAGDSYTLAVKTDGHLSGWGDGQCGQLDGVGGTATNWLSASAGTYGSSALRTDGTLWMWGSVCPDDEVPKLPPTQVGAGTNWRSVSTA